MAFQSDTRTYEQMRTVRSAATTKWPPVRPSPRVHCPVARALSRASVSSTLSCPLSMDEEALAPRSSRAHTRPQEVEVKS